MSAAVHRNGVQATVASRNRLASVGIRSLIATVIALAMLITPTVTSASVVLDAPAGHAMQMMDQTGHCQMPLGGSTDHHKPDGKSCCVSMCMAVAVAPAVPGQASPLREQMAQFASPKAYHGLLAEIATPPPRTS